MELGPICFVANDFDFFFRHFRPALAAGQANGLKCVALLPLRDTDVPSVPAHVQVLPSPINRQSFSIHGLFSQALWLIWQLRKVKPKVVVVFSLRASLVMALALPFLRVPKVVMSITGLGVMDLVNDARTRVLRRLTYALLRAISLHRSCHFIFENSSDAKKIGFAVGQPVRQTILVGAGVDPLEFSAKKLPEFPPYKFATVSRLVWSKGVDLAIQAISELAEEGYPVELSVFGEIDGANPYPVDVESLSGRTGITFRGRTDDVPRVWEDHHAAVFASRGGEGLPRALLEAASCGRPSIVTDVAGCADFIRDGVEGYIAAANSVPSLKEAIKRLISEPNEMERLGKLARDRVLATSTVQVIQQQYGNIFGFERGVVERGKPDTSYCPARVGSTLQSTEAIEL